MAIAHQFAYQKAATLEEAVQLLVRAGPAGRVLAGGTDLVPWMRDDAVHPNMVVDIKGIDGLDQIDRDGDHLYIGPLVTFADLLESALVRRYLPFLQEMADTVGSPGIRHRATVVGNICSSVPSCDAGPALLVLEAAVGVHGPDGGRTVPIDEWFVGPRRNALATGEIVTGISIPLPPDPHGAVYVKLQRYEGEDLSQAGVAILVTADDEYRIAFGAVGPTPTRAREIETRLAGRPLTEELIDEVRQLVAAAISPITDMRATKEYRSRMCEIMLARGLRAAVNRREGDGPPHGHRLI